MSRQASRPFAKEWLEAELSQKSPGQISRETGVPIKRIQRMMVREGIPSRTKSEAQKLALANGVVKPPTQGRKRTKEEKIAIGKAVSESWTEDKRAHARQRGKEAWAGLSESDKDSWFAQGRQGILKAAKEGSSLEIYLVEQLRAAGYNAIHHQDGLCGGENLQVDIMLPDMSVVIEVDGPTHRQPTYGAENLTKVQESDMKKNGILLQYGFVVVRLICEGETTGIAARHDCFSRLLGILQGVAKEFPPIGDRLIYMEF